MSATNTATDTTLTQATERYVTWVQSLRELHSSTVRALVSYYNAIKEGLDNGIWREGPYQSAERFLHMELGIHPQRWAHWTLAMQRFGESRIERWGFEVATTVLRTPQGSAAEHTVLQAIDSMTNERGGMSPSAEAVLRVVEKVVPPQRRVGRVETEEDRLRRKIRDLETQLATAQRKLATTERSLTKANGLVEDLRTRLAATRAKKAA